RPGDRPLPGGLVAGRGRAGPVGGRYPGAPDLPGEAGRLHVRLHLAAFDPAPAALRPADGPGLAGAPAGGPGQPRGHGAVRRPVAERVVALCLVGSLKSQVSSLRSPRRPRPVGDPGSGARVPRPGGVRMAFVELKAPPLPGNPASAAVADLAAIAKGLGL